MLYPSGFALQQGAIKKREAVGGLANGEKGCKMIIISGGSGFIGSALLWRLNQESFDNIMIVDSWQTSSKWLNIRARRFTQALPKEDFLPWLQNQADPREIEVVFHLGACSSTEEKNVDYLLRNNVHYSMELFRYCAQHEIPFIYASSAATYGGAERGFADEHSAAAALEPINPYGLSKKIFDSWVLQQCQLPPLWVGLKFFNVFGPNEYHKGAMRSLVCKAVPQIRETGLVKLFKSSRPNIRDGEQSRDFVYVKDVVEVMLHFWRQAQNLENREGCSGLYNVGTGQARSFYDLVKAVFVAMEKPCAVSWVEMPDSIKDGYQYFTEAEMTKLYSQGGYTKPFMSLEAAVYDYVVHYLGDGEKYL